MSSDTAARPATLCVTNAKGGTGKTTIAINVAGALNERGQDVLFVDMDPQGNATEGLGLLDAYDAEPPTLFDVLTDRDQRGAIDDLIVSHEEMDIVPSSVDLLQAEHELTIADLMAWAKTDPSVDIDPAALSSLAINVTPETVTGDHAMDLLDRALAELEGEYDVVIIDSPPFYGKLTDTAIYAARSVLVPALTEASSERAIELLVDQIAALESQVDIEVDTVGVVANRVEQTNEDAAMLEWLGTVFDEYPVWEVRKRVALQRAFSAGTSIFAAEQPVDMESVFLDIAEEIETQFGVQHTEVTA
ncbi:SojB protein [Halorhabdus tiamatea SARL4B]|uniref:Cobyrinic acid ac-diamide synthase n=1 Tax=Halorhabdus tiamatea SARL4B TaxID=1033806 RepID=F7PP85_9EURY|nr:ParA family protein [Halorhabdus tiamatea]ERJ07120.1 SojB protein [Halorhabdus tiamatea SARL4B]CCQ32741.1 cobyrinic acid ac-diamide synthase [Halorhabdus tiamatea SARL4B]